MYYIYNLIMYNELLLFVCVWCVCEFNARKMWILLKSANIEN